MGARLQREALHLSLGKARRRSLALHRPDPYSSELRLHLCQGRAIAGKASRSVAPVLPEPIEWRGRREAPFATWDWVKERVVLPGLAPRAAVLSAGFIGPVRGLSVSALRYRRAFGHRPKGAGRAPWL